jgi:hypothetical protein
MAGLLISVIGSGWAMGIGASAGLLAARVGIGYLVRHRNLRIRISSGRTGLALDESGPAPPPS